MKKIVSFILAAIVLFSFASCFKSESKGEEGPLIKKID